MWNIGSMEAGTAGASWFSEHQWDHIFDNPPHIVLDWDTNTGDSNTTTSQSTAVDVDLDAVDWSSWPDHLIVDHINGCSQLVNNLSFSPDLQAIGDYLMDADQLQDDNNNIEEDLISSPRKDDAIAIDRTDTISSAVIPGDQLVSDYHAVTRSSSESKLIVTANIAGSSSQLDHVDHGSVEYKGLTLLHLLTACAEAISQGAQDLAEVILGRLRQLVSCTGSTMERVGYYLFDALLHYSNLNNSLTHLELNDKTTKEHFLGALKLLHVTYPYIRIPHFTANECILEAVVAAGGGNNNVRIHIIDFDIMEGMQWPPLMEALRNNDDVRHLKITAIKWADEPDEERDMLYCGQTGRRLSECATSAGIPFSYQETDLKGLKDCILGQSQDIGEIVIVNCMWQLPHMLNLRNKSQVLEFLVGTRHLNPVAVTLATGPHGSELSDSHACNFLENFVRRLEELCAIFDSLEAGLPEHGLARAMVERIFFGAAMSKRVIMNSTAVRGDDTRDSNIVDLPVRCGYEECSISNDNMINAKCNLLMCNGSSGCYGVELAGHHRLVLRWGSTPLLWVSTWKSPSGIL